MPVHVCTTARTRSMTLTHWPESDVLNVLDVFGSENSFFSIFLPPDVFSLLSLRHPSWRIE